MLMGTVLDVPEAITGLIGAAFIGLSVWSSIYYKRRVHAQPFATGEP